MSTSVHPPFAYVGGKSKLASRIVNTIRHDFPNQTVLLSPFLGGGAVELRAMHALGIACLGNDIEFPLINCWQWVRINARQVVAICKELMPMSREKWDTWYREMDALVYEPSAENAAKYIMLRAVKVPQCWGFSPEQCKGFNKPSKHRARFARLSRFRAPKLVATCNDFEEFIHQSGVGTIYADPPYYDIESVYAHHDVAFREHDHERLAKTLLLRGNFILSYNDCEWVRKRYAHPSVSFREVRTSYENRRQRGKDAKVTELLLVSR